MKKTVTKIYYTLLLAGIGLTTFAQTARVTGKLVNDQGVKLDYATVSILKATDSTVIKGALTNNAGVYIFDNIKPGDYIVKATNVGYTKAASATFTVTADKGDLTVPDLKMSANVKTLNTVNITSTKPLIERKIDRTVMNVENSVLAAGNTAMEILERAPGVTIDKDDNISLKGKQGVTVMINDKLTYLSPAQLATLLRSTDGTTIQSIEIISNPSAKYDAAGNSGIINIKLKKNKQNGTNGSLTAAVASASRLRESQNLNINHKEGNLNIFGLLSHGDIPNYQRMDLNRKTVDAGNNTYFRQEASSPQVYHYNNFKLGADLDVTKNNTVGVVISGNSNKEKDLNNNFTKIGQSMNTVDSALNTSSEIRQTFSNLAVNFNDRLQLDTLGQTLSADLDYSKFKNNSKASYNTDYYLPDGTIQHAPELLRNETPSDIEIYSAKADYAKPLSKTVKIETGAKFSSVKTDNDLRAGKFNGADFVNDTTRSNRFIYTEKITAGYFNINKQYKNGSVQLGLRAEYTQSNGNLLGSTPVDRSYLNFFPSLFINQTLNSKNEFNFSFSRRIDRPNYSELNPFVYYLDPYTFSKGNAFLKPQYTNNFELGYVYNKTIDVNFGYSHTTDANIEIILTQGKKSFQTNLNLATQTNYNVNIFSPYTIAKWWTGNANLNGFYTKFKADSINGHNIDNGTAAFVFKTTQTFLFGTFKGEVSLNYSSRMTYGIYEMHDRKSIDAAVSQTFADKKFNVKFGVDDVFNLRRNDLDSHELGNDFSIRQKRDSRVYRLTVTYNFGNAKIKQREHRTGAEEEAGRAGGGN
ncbi:outer membrane beta-barrel family protein [Mucilaginibacter sp. UR6-11]|uniref:outer membrane beta-barrel family protein n=1 Tax=Mucilaginibacter sp. UR6-11 TaxID=1435644 RepID=UPI001E5CEE26|nr:outer membrane beta-barrel family protein [Mucilaginibacter sp. UR6-11]MCC8424403.1 TonB-dependent receptor family protein [Mucilaginibacter sp. UR6-11]